jgi:RND family efflux transporter MFP subunit
MKPILAGAVSALALALSCGCSSSQPSVMAASAPASATPAAAPAAPRESVWTGSGPLVVENQVDVAAQRDGMVVQILGEPGMRVKAGQLLAKLDDRQISTDLEAARAKTSSTAADLQNWKAEAKVLDADYQRAQKMWEANLITKEQLEHARYKAESDVWDVKRVEQLLVNAQASERSLELELEKTHIRAPFSGVVARRYIRAGQRVASGDRLFWVTAEGPLRIRFTLPEQMIGRLRTGQEIEVASPDVPGETRKARIVEVSPVVDPASGTIEALAQLQGRPGAMRPGMTATVRIPNPR